MKNPLAISLAILAFIVLGVAVYFFSTYEIKTETTETRLQSWAVIKNRYLAAEEYLKQQGKMVDTPRATKFFRTLENKSPAKTTVLLLGKVDYLTSDQEYELFEWVEKGGTLVLEVNAGSEILTGLVIKVSEDSEHNDKSSSLHSKNEKIAKVNFTKNYNITIDDEHYEPTLKAFVKEGSGYSYLALPYGDGALHLLSKMDIWDNRTIGKEDHAWLLDFITGDEVIIVKLRSSEGSGLSKVWSALIDNFLYALIFLLLFIALLLWRQGMRSGAIEENLSRDRRTLSEYLKALANFYQQEQGYGALIVTLQREINIRMNMRYHAYQTLSLDEKNQQLSQLTQISVEAITLLMSPAIESQKVSTLQFIKRVAELQKIRNML